jgi:hypothetical protein
MLLGLTADLNFFLAKGIEKFCVVNNDILFAKDFLKQLKKLFKKQIFLAEKFIMLKVLSITKNVIKKKISVRFYGMRVVVLIGKML